jgi:phosphatidylglycerophosphatase A
MSRQDDRAAKTAFHPSAKVILSSPVHFLAFGFGSGLSPIAPGTAGTLAALPIWWLLSGLPTSIYVAVVVVLGVLGCWLCGESSRRLGVHDHGGIVFDEIVGFLITALPLQPAFGLPSVPLPLALLAAFGLFRLFDIWKPWPIAVLDRRVHGGTGIMLDDVVAGVFAAIILELGLKVLAF